MTDKALCPWCGSEMRCVCYERGKLYQAYMKCNGCDATGPVSLSHNEMGVRDQARAAVLRRYEPPVRPLTLKEIDLEKSQILFVENKTDIYSDWEKTSDLRLEAFLHCETYGKTWRCWPRKPTEEEREAAKWDEY